MVHVRFASTQASSTSSLLAPPPQQLGHSRRRSTGDHDSPDVQSLERLRQMRSVSSRESLGGGNGGAPVRRMSGVGGWNVNGNGVPGRRDGRASAEFDMPPRPNSASATASPIHFPSPSSSTTPLGPRPSSLAPPGPGRPRTPKLSGSPSHIGIGNRPTVGQAKAVLVDALDGYDCMLEDKLRVLRRLMMEVQEELIASASRPSPPLPANLPVPNAHAHNHHHSPTGNNMPPIGEAVRAVKEANKAKAVALAQLQRAVLEQRGPSAGPGSAPGRRS